MQVKAEAQKRLTQASEQNAIRFVVQASEVHEVHGVGLVKDLLLNLVYLTGVIVRYTRHVV